jgi:hypothetical protein
VTPEHCPTCGSVVEVVTGDEGTSSFRPRLLTDEMVERAAEAIAYELDSDATYFWRQIARGVLEAALGNGS